MSGTDRAVAEDKKLHLSGTEARKILETGKAPPEWFMRQEISNIILEKMKNGGSLEYTATAIDKMLTEIEKVYGTNIPTGEKRKIIVLTDEKGDPGSDGLTIPKVAAKAARLGVEVEVVMVFESFLGKLKRMQVEHYKNSPGLLDLLPTLRPTTDLF